MKAEDVAAFFTRADGAYWFARWGRPLVPVVFGVDDATLLVVKEALQGMAALAGVGLGEVDTELGANLMLFFVAEWDELRHVPGLDQLVEGFAALVSRLEAAGANQYRVFRFDAAGAIRAAFVFVRMDADLMAVPVEALALQQAVQVIVLWSDLAFAAGAPLVWVDGRVQLRADVGGIVRACYDRVLPDMARDAGHAWRVAARVGRLG
jgi:hypothetical protein